jgi:cysteinyl-tRNA synthetase
MNLQIYNTLTRKKEAFVPIQAGNVKMYVCGPTVYNFLHVGNFRGPVFFNLVRNWLETLGFKVEFALNFTDIDDRIIERAQVENISPSEVSEKYIAEYKKDYLSLGLKPHTYNPKVTEHLESIQKIVSELVTNQKAYVASGEVLYSVKSFEGYGKLSNRVTEELQAGSRIEIDAKKKDPMDFSLWKPAKPGEPSWPSQWGPGRPGWHIECSAMIREIFGEQIDIHGGGSDLIFPHHENEIAQSEGATGKPFVKYWMHNNMLNFSGNKMSKSLGNIVRLRDFVKDYHPEIYKYMILSVHYRSVSDFGEQGIERSIRELARFYSILNIATQFAPAGPGADFKSDQVTEVWTKISNSLNDDFSTPEVFATLFELVRQFNSQVKIGMKENPAILAKCMSILELFRRLNRVTALFGEEPAAFLLFLDNMLLLKKGLKREDIQKLVDERWQLKQAKDFAGADLIRKKLGELEISVMDTALGSQWEVTK